MKPMAQEGIKERRATAYVLESSLLCPGDCASCMEHASVGSTAPLASETKIYKPLALRSFPPSLYHSLPFDLICLCTYYQSTNKARLHHG